MLNESDLLLGRVPYLSTETSVTYISNKLKDYDTIPIIASLNSDTLSLISHLIAEKTTPRITDDYYNYEEVPI
jgi:predicted metalloprotease with PDZ domain